MPQSTFFHGLGELGRAYRVLGWKYESSKLHERDTSPVGRTGWVSTSRAATWSSICGVSTEIESRIASLGIQLPTPPAPQGSYVPVVRAGEMLFCSGVLPMLQGELVNPGIVGLDVTVEQAQEAARVCIANLLANIRAELGTLDRVERFVRLGGFVASTAGFGSQPEVINAASNLLAEIFGDAGRHARAAVGVASLPRNACVEIEAVVAVRP